MLVVGSNSRIKMRTDLLTEQFVEILLDKDITKQPDLDVFQTIYSFENHKASASQVGRILGVKSKYPASPINLQIGRLAKRIAQKHEINFTERKNSQFKYWDLFFDGWDEPPFFVWQLKPNLISALEEANLTGKEIYSDEIPFDIAKQLFEGAKQTVIINSYERNSQARKKCLEHYGSKCSACNFDFEQQYGEIGKGFIHVHHVIPLSEIKRAYEVNPIEDLRPVCPNCHAMLHKENPPLSIEELKGLLKTYAVKIVK